MPEKLISLLGVFVLLACAWACSLECVASVMWTPIGRTTSTRRTLVLSEKFTKPAPDGFHHSEVSQFRQHFIDLLARVSSEVAFAAVAGATLLLSRLADSDEHKVALATGAWLESARLEMASAGLCYEDYPAGSSDDAFDRESIIRLSMQRAAKRYGSAGTVYVGDGVWDARACRGVGIPFIGIGTGQSRNAAVSRGSCPCLS